MNETQGQKPTIKMLVTLVIIAIVTAVAVMFVQRLILKESHPAITGGVVGAVIAFYAIRLMRKNALS